MTTTNIKRANDKAILSITIWPHRSCSRENFHLLILFIACGLLLPPLLFFDLRLALSILPFSFVSISLLLFFSEKNYLDSQLRERLRIFPENIELHREEPKGDIRTWSANPFWTRVNLYKDGPIENYLTLIGNGKEVEVGSFLTPKERKDLKHLIEDSLQKLKSQDSSS